MIEPYRLPEDGWYQLSAIGRFPHTPTGLTQVVDEDACRAIVDRFAQDAKAPNFPGILVDFDHFSLEKDKPSEAAGWITALELRPESGLWAQIRWTDKGEEAVAGGRYRFISPVWRRDECIDLEDGKVRPTRLCNAGLTNDPNIGGAVPLSNSAPAPVREAADPPAPDRHRGRDAGPGVRTSAPHPRPVCFPRDLLANAGFVSDKQRRYFFAKRSQGRISPATTAPGSWSDIPAPPKLVAPPKPPRVAPPELTPDPANLGRFTFKSPRIPATRRPAPGVPVNGPPSGNLETMPGPGTGKLPIQPLDPDGPHILPVGQRRGFSISDMEAQVVADYAMQVAPSPAAIPPEVSQEIQAVKYTFNQEAARKAIDTIAELKANAETSLTRSRMKGTSPAPKGIAAAKSTKPATAAGKGVKTATPNKAPTDAKGNVLPGIWKENGIVYISDPEWWAAHRQPELSKPGHLSAAGQWTPLSAQRKKGNQAAMSSKARRQGGMPGMSGLYNRRFLANAGPLTAEQRKAMFAKMGREGRLPSSAYQPRDHTPTRDYRARIESLQQTRLALQRQAPEPPAVRDFATVDTRQLRDDLLRQGKPLAEIQQTLREAEAKNLRVSVEIDKIALRLKGKYPDARSRKAALAEEIDRIAREDAKAVDAYEKDLARHQEKLAKVDAQIRAEDIRRSEDWNRAGQREENDLAGVAQRAAAEKAVATATAKTERESDPVRLNTRQKAERSAYWDAIERGNLDLAEKIAPGANHDSNLALWDEVRLTPDQAGNAKARTAATAKAAALRKMSP